MKWIGQYIYDQISRFRSDVYVENSDLYIYNSVNDGSPAINMGSTATNRLEIKSVYNSGAQTLCDIDFTTYTASSSAND